MKKELDPKLIGTIIGLVVVVAALGLYMGIRGQGDRSGPPVIAKYEGGGKSFGAGWRPGVPRPPAGTEGSTQPGLAGTKG